MAGVRYSFTNLFPPIANSTPNRTNSSLKSSVSTQSPSKLTKRKNHLRPKIRKTLTKPHPNPLPPHQLPNNPVIPIEPIEPLSEPSIQISSDPVLDNHNSNSVEEFSASSGAIESNSGVVEASNVGPGSFPARTFIRFGLCLVGLFVFQTICAVWILGSADSEDKDGNLKVGSRDGKMGLNGNASAGKFEIRNGGFVYVDKAEMERKIGEIRKMAREARDREEEKLRANDADSNSMGDGDNGDGDVEGESSNIRSVLVKEVDGRLKTLRKSLNSIREKSTLLKVNSLKKSSEAAEKEKKEAFDAMEEGEMLMIKKKYKFRSLTTSPRDRPKGFQGSDNGSDLRRKNSDMDAIHQTVRKGGAAEDSGLLDQIQKLDKQNRSSGGSDSMLFDKGNETKSATENSSHLQTSSGRSRNKQHTSKQSISRAKDKRSNSDPNLWWLNLPYVLAILMQNGSNNEGMWGLYTLKITSDAVNQKQTSYTVAFEDRIDATNFSFLLESFFEDLQETTIDIVPLSIKELSEAVRSQSMKLIVVKKGQLQLYAGQPLADVEAALRALV
ncbi:hypothetical protein Nepgr_020622 [Nepenthes gracilis]|uniref:Uncharacterized protein n=1 Tax=Nepenthes gracilis TaxID=150966 RepID=A0AAD3XWK0_NEPGR|nr:hypothetical protein Nepgr_020622 [Nepenthes gracilis]